MRYSKNRQVFRGGAAVLAVAAGALAVTGTSSAVAASRTVSVPAGTVALTPDHSFSLPLNASQSAWTIAPDGTFWNANQGAVGHYDAQGNNIGGFSTSQYIPPSELAVDGSRLYLSYPTSGSGDAVAAYSLSGGPGQTPTYVDGGTSSRYDGQASMRVVGNTMFLPTGQRNKLGLVDLSTFATSPYYPQSWYGIDINDASPPVAPSWEGCAYGAGGSVIGSPANCGVYGGDYQSSSVLNYPVDVAVGTGGALYVLNAGGNVQVLTPGPQGGGYVPGAAFSGPGTGTGQLASPASIVRDATSGDLFVADTGNDRISEFTAGGAFLASFGYGVLDGANAWETCGVGIGACLRGLPNVYYNQLAIGNGQLFVEDAAAGRGHIEVLDLSNGSGSGATTNPGGTTPVSTPSPAGGGATVVTATAPAVTTHLAIRLKADHTSVASHHRARLTATVGPSLLCSGRTVQFQVLTGRSWTSVGKVKVKNCAASAWSPAITKATKVRAIIAGSGHGALATSSTLVLKVATAKHP